MGRLEFGKEKEESELWYLVSIRTLSSISLPGRLLHNHDHCLGEEVAVEDGCRQSCVREGRQVERKIGLAREKEGRRVGESYTIWCPITHGFRLRSREICVLSLFARLSR